MKYLLFDIGGTKTRLAVTTDLVSFDEPTILDTPHDFDEAISVISSKALEICGGQMARAAGGIAGPLNKEKTGLFDAINLSDWNGKNFAEEFSKKISAPVSIENDTAIVGLGEAVYGPGKNYNIVVYFTISTGVNAAKISNHAIDENVFGFEVGKQIIDIDNSMNMGSSGLGTLEDFVSGRETERRYGMHPKEIPDRSIWKDYAKWAAVGVYNTVLHWSPEMIVFGGSMMNDIEVVDIDNKLRELLADVYPESPKLVKAELGSFGGLWGALHFIKSSQ